MCIHYIKSLVYLLLWLRCRPLCFQPLGKCGAKYWMATVKLHCMFQCSPHNWCRKHTEKQNGKKCDIPRASDDVWSFKGAERFVGLLMKREATISTQSSICRGEPGSCSLNLEGKPLDVQFIRVWLSSCLLGQPQDPETSTVNMMYSLLLVILRVCYLYDYCLQEVVILLHAKVHLSCPTYLFFLYY